MAASANPLRGVLLRSQRGIGLAITIGVLHHPATTVQQGQVGPGRAALPGDRRGRGLGAGCGLRVRACSRVSNFLPAWGLRILLRHGRPSICRRGRPRRWHWPTAAGIQGRTGHAWQTPRNGRRTPIAALAPTAGKSIKLDSMDPITPPPRSRTIYLLPNLFTTAGLFAGFRDHRRGQRGFRQCQHRRVRGGGDGWPGRARGAPDRYQQRIRRAVRLAGRPGQLRHGPGAGDVPLVAVVAEVRRSAARPRRLGRGLPVCGLRGAAPGPLQYPGGGGRQALVRRWPARQQRA